MAVLETEFKKFAAEMRKEINELKRLIVTRAVAEKWVRQDVACIMLNIKPRQLANIRIHVDKNGSRAGSISWKKGKGKNCLYYLPDIEKYNSSVIIN